MLPVLDNAHRKCSYLRCRKPMRFTCPHVSLIEKQTRIGRHAVAASRCISRV
uniref:Uncharacterized protein n=1 Tax=Anopheles minimus TaxID=112268 RepID=A0A182WNA8_9DIPT